MVTTAERASELGESRPTRTRPDQSCEHFIIKYSKLLKKSKASESAVELMIAQQTDACAQPPEETGESVGSLHSSASLDRLSERCNGLRMSKACNTYN